MSTRDLTIALVGNPNAGKTTIFNALTGLRQKVGNYPGITVERKAGTFFSQHGEKLTLIDLPGTYSLSARSPDEAVTRDALMSHSPQLDHPDLVILVLDASNLARHLYLATQVIELRMPCILALNMMDVARNAGIVIDTEKLESLLGAPVVLMDASRNQGMTELKIGISRVLNQGNPAKEYGSPQHMALPSQIGTLLDQRIPEAEKLGLCQSGNGILRLLYLVSHHDSEHFGFNPEQLSFVRQVKNELTALEAGWEDRLVSNRYDWIETIVEKTVRRGEVISDSAVTTDRIDRWLLHPVLGWVILAGMLFSMFFLIFSFAQIPMGMIESLMSWLRDQVVNLMPAGDLRDLLTDGVLSGLEGIVIFLPQILILFFFISIMEETGYMARVAFLMDRLMGRVGLNGKSFVPLLSSYACAVPGVMAARTIENPKDRLITILVAPLASCSARLPVYLLMIAAMVPEEQMSIWVKVGLMFLMYFLGTIGAFAFAWIFRHFLAKGQASPMLLELPPYRMPRWKSVGLFLWERAQIFIRRAGTIILGLTILMWAATTWPKFPESQSGNPPTDAQKLEYSLAGRLGKIIEPVVSPLGYDWKIGIGLLTSFAAREVFVSTMAVIYSVEESDDEAITRKQVRDKLAMETRDGTPDGPPLYTPLVCLGIMVFYVFAMQCLSTVAVVKRETGGWKWPIFQIVYMTATAYIMALLVFQIGRALGFS
ncbi:MAG: ferrous iron transport protein B [Verrucomicrobia bacterium]|nr:ferrous iron transport protein B [Verrucomicrobiota bacterium]